MIKRDRTNVKLKIDTALWYYIKLLAVESHMSEGEVLDGIIRDHQTYDWAHYPTTKCYKAVKASNGGALLKEHFSRRGRKRIPFVGKVWIDRCTDTEADCYAQGLGYGSYKEYELAQCIDEQTEYGRHVAACFEDKGLE